MVQVKERLFQEVKSKYETFNTDLMRMEYLESTIKIPDIGMDVKKFAYTNLADLYNNKMMYEKAAKSMWGKAGYDITYREKIESYVKAAKLYAKAGNFLGAEDMFTRAKGDANSEQKIKIEEARKKIYINIGEELENKNRMSNASKFYEHLLTLKLEEKEKEEIKKKLSNYYKKMGRFHEAKIVEAR